MEIALHDRSLERLGPATGSEEKFAGSPDISHGDCVSISVLSPPDCDSPATGASLQDAAP